MRSRALILLLVAVALAAAGVVVHQPRSAEAGPSEGKLRTLNSRFYQIHTDLGREDLVEFGKHMDRIFAQYQSRFQGFRSRRAGQMPLYLFSTSEGYVEFMARYQIDARNSGGMFFVQQDGQGLATWATGKSRSETFAVLQHEGFHQFAWNYIGPELPVWINEGIAQYFEDGIIVGRKMKLGLVDARRLALVKSAIERDAHIDLSALLSVTGEEWGATLRNNPERAALQYAQSWSMVYFLIHGDRGRYQRALSRYLQLVSKGRDSGRAMREAFGTDNLELIETRWKKYITELEPDPITLASERMAFLAAALRFMAQHGEEFPKTLEELKTNLQRRRFALTRSFHGMSSEQSALDDDLYTYERKNGTTGTFRLLAPSKAGLPPRITAPGLDPEPTLAWYTDEQGQLADDITFR